MNINWYPGHMLKTTKILKENLKLVDIVYELLDARIPLSSKNPDLDQILGDKVKIVILNKSDMADRNINKRWVEWYRTKGIYVVLANSLTGKGIDEVTKATSGILSKSIQKKISRGIRRPVTRCMVVGIPNVGKSSFINRLTKGKKAETGNKPGVTKTKQWVKLKNDIELLDTPGILWPKFQDKSVAVNLAVTGAIKDELFDHVEVCVELIEMIRRINKDYICNRYNIDWENKTGYQVLKQIAENRKCVLPGGEIDYYRAAKLVINDFRNNKLGYISLERPI